MNEKIIPFPVRKPLTDKERKEQQRRRELKEFIRRCERLYEQQQTVRRWQPPTET